MHRCSACDTGFPASSHLTSLGISALLLATLLFPVRTAAAQGETPLASPRTAFTTYLQKMNTYAEDPGSDRGRRALAEALSCLDLSEIPEALREDTGKRLAIQLKRFLDRHEHVRPETLPTEVAAGRFVWRKPGDDLEVALERDSSGSWRFAFPTQTLHIASIVADGASPAPDGRAAGVDDPITSGRLRAEEVLHRGPGMSRHAGGVDFSDPDSMRTSPGPDVRRQS